MLNSLQTQEDLGTSFQVAVLVEFFNNFFSFVIRLELCLLPTFFSKMNFLFYAQAFDDVMKFEYLKY